MGVSSSRSAMISRMNLLVVSVEHTENLFGCGGVPVSVFPVLVVISKIVLAFDFIEVLAPLWGHVVQPEDAAGCLLKYQ